MLRRSAGCASLSVEPYDGPQPDGASGARGRAVRVVRGIRFSQDAGADAFAMVSEIFSPRDSTVNGFTM